MAETTELAANAADAPSSDDVARAERFAREPILLNGERPADLTPGTPRRAALDAALHELDAGRETPSVEWRRDFALALGLERLLAEKSPRLVDGTELDPHQVDALSGTLTELLREVQESRNGSGSPAAVAKAAQGNGRPAVEDAVEDEEDEEVEVEEVEEVEEDDEDVEDEEAEEEDEEAEVEEVEVAEDEEPKDWEEGEIDPDVDADAPEDPGASRRFWFEHATGAGKTVAAVGFIDASRTGGVLILTHRRNLVDQFIGEISGRGYGDRLSPPLLDDADPPDGPVTVETYQWFVRNSQRISDVYSIVICDEAHTALGEKTSACIRAWQGPTFIGMTATGALIARHVADLFPTQTSRFDLAQAARRGVISPLRCIRIPPGPGVRTIAKVPLRKGEVDQDFDQEELAALLDQEPFNVAVADLYRSHFDGVPGVVYTAGVRHAKNVARAFVAAGLRGRAVSGETPKRELAEILASFERGEIDVLCNAMLLAEGWNSPRATICMHLAPTASRRVYQQRVGRVTRRAPGKEAGLVIDFVHPATTHDETIVTLHSLLGRDIYRGGAIVVGPVRRGRGRRVRVDRRIVPVSDNSERRIAVLERELWRVAVENLDHAEQHAWAALAGARVSANGWRRARAMLQDPSTSELRRRFLLTCAQRNRDRQLRLKALTEASTLGDPEAFDDAIEIVAGWPREERRAGAKALLEALSEHNVGRRDQAQAWVWQLAELTRELHEEYAAQRWPETKRLLGLLVNSAGRAHGRNARRLVQAVRKQDHRLATSLLASAVAHTAEGEEVLRGARMRTARKPSAVARELLKNFPSSKRRRRRRRRRSSERANGAAAEGANRAAAERANGAAAEGSDGEVNLAGGERDALPGVERDDQGAGAVDSTGDADLAVPADPASE